MKWTFFLTLSLAWVSSLLLPVLGQSNIYLEAGAIASTFYSASPEYQPPGTEQGLFQPVVGFRAGVALEHDFEGVFGLKTGASYSFKGAEVPEDFRWSLGYLCFPVLAVWRPVPALKVGLGLEFSSLLTNNAALPPTNSVALGARTELMWQISPQFRLLLHSTLDVTNSEKVTYTDDQGNPIATNVYRHLTGGLSLAYRLHRFRD